MDNRKIEEMAEKAYANMANAPGLGFGNPQGCVTTAKDADSPCRASLMERVSSQCHRSGQEARRLGRLQELQYLLDKNPEIARILDLLEEVRG